MSSWSPPPTGLAALEAAVRRDLDILDYPRRSWVLPVGGAGEALDVLIIGGGQGGQGAAFGLMREKIHSLLVVDENAPGQEGPWRTFARMRSLRTPKYLTSIDLGVPSLTCRAWFEAQHGEAAWQALTFVPKETWAEYLLWHRRVLSIPVRNHTRVTGIAWDPGLRCFVAEVAGGEPLRARKVVLATGIDGSGRWETPPLVEALPAHRYAHTRDPIDFAALSGKRIGVLGAGASAFDNAVMALEAGARSVDLFYRRRDLPKVNPYRWAEFTGFLKHHGDLPDGARWRFILEMLRMGQLPPRDTYLRALAFATFRMHAASPWNGVHETPEGVRVETPTGAFLFDFVILGSGFVTDLSRRPELRALLPHIALWRDRFTPPSGQEHDDLGRHPYLGPGFELQEKVPGEAPYLQGVFNYTFGCLPSLGFGGASISGLKYSLPRLVDGITRQLYTESWEAHLGTLCAYNEVELP
jgi:cation diffusion facilitator CzcD-associated flavoprotein CzcO